MIAVSSRTLVTGFLGFGRFAENPSALLASSSGRPFALLDVRYDKVDAFFDTLDASSFDRLLMLGVAGNSTTFRLERMARNRYGKTPDVSGVVQEPGPIDPLLPATCASTLWCESTCANCVGESVVLSDDAGDYLCNYSLHVALQRLPKRRVGFLHVPPVEAMPLDQQRRVLARILDAIESQPPT